ncbi:MAG: EngA family GTP-binding protein, partial [Desulfurobacteriaceae bacterium]
MRRLPVVAIVGRPNVGKSSLFNRLLGKKVAIIDDTPGVTRDRIVQEAEIDGHRVILVDTGGVVEKDAHQFAKETTEQAKRAMEEADVIVFVVDGKEGVNPLDLEVAKILRKWKKPVILAVNKIDEPFMEDRAYEFYQLGFDEVIPISTIHKIGIQTLKEKILEKLPPELRENAKREQEKVEKREKAERLISGEEEEELTSLQETLERGEEYEIEEEEKEPI